MNKNTKKLKSDFKKRTENGSFKGSLKEFAKEHHLGQEWIDRKMMG